LTVLISLLTSAFASVQANETEQVLFQRAIKTIERCHSEVRGIIAWPCGLAVHSHARCHLVELLCADALHRLSSSSCLRST